MQCSASVRNVAHTNLMEDCRRSDTPPSVRRRPFQPPHHFPPISRLIHCHASSTAPSRLPHTNCFFRSSNFGLWSFGLHAQDKLNNLLLPPPFLCTASVFFPQPPFVLSFFRSIYTLRTFFLLTTSPATLCPPLISHSRITYTHRIGSYFSGLPFGFAV